MFFAPALALALTFLSSSVRAADERLVRFGRGANDTASISEDVLDAIRFTPPGTRFGARAQAAHPGLLAALSARRRMGPGFIDLTEATLPSIHAVAPVVAQPHLLSDAAAPAAYPTPDASKYPELAEMFAQVSPEGLTATIASLSNFTTRYYRSSSARDSALWIQDAFTQIVGATNVALVENSFNQPNVIGAVPRAESSDNDEIVIIGAHLDSINQSGGSSARAPGADDDASGIAVVLQALQILTAAGFRGTRRIEAHAYAGEEGGLLGSARTASQYKSAGKLVRGMLQMDMVAYQKGSKPVITLTNDTDASPPLQAFVRAVVGEYVPEATLRTAACGYACTDHYSWIDQGYPGISIDEAGPDDRTLNPYYHSANDTLDKLDLTKASVFVKAVLAFAVELSEHAPTIGSSSTAAPSTSTSATSRSTTSRTTPTTTTRTTSTINTPTSTSPSFPCPTWWPWC